MPQVAESSSAWALIESPSSTLCLEPLDPDGQRALRSFRGDVELGSEASAKAKEKPKAVTDPAKVAQRMDAAELARAQLMQALEYRETRKTS